MKDFYFERHRDNNFRHRMDLRHIVFRLLPWRWHRLDTGPFYRVDTGFCSYYYPRNNGSIHVVRQEEPMTALTARSKPAAAGVGFAL